MKELLGETLDRYEIISLLGEGGMGAVFKARDLNLERDVAVKVMRPRFSQQSNFRERFREEARAAARLDHPGIVRVLDFDQAKGYLYLVMELIPGQSLRQALEDLGTPNRPWPAAPGMPVVEAIQLVRQVCLAIDYAHRQGVLHGDIKPDNIMLEPEPCDGLPYRPVLTDFGLARLAGEDPGMLQGPSMGTLPYMSPEQVREDPSDSRSDIYSLGILLYELLVGQTPFPATTLGQAADSHSFEPQYALRSLRPDLPEALERVILTALAKDPAARFADAGAMARALADIAPAGGPFGELATALEGVAGATAYETAGRAAPQSPSFYDATGRTSRPRARQMVDTAVLREISSPAPVALDKPPAEFSKRSKASPNGRQIAATMEQRQLSVEAGGRAIAALVVRNKGPVMQPCTVSVEGIPSEWVPQAPLQVQLMPHEQQEIRFAIQLPRSRKSRSGRQPFAVNVSSQDELVRIGCVLDVQGKRESNIGKVGRKGSILTRLSPLVAVPVIALCLLMILLLWPQSVEVPDVMGLAPAMAQAQLTASDLSIGETLAEYSGNIESGQVIRSEPPAGTKARPESQVNLIVSVGPNQAQVPFVEGLAMGDAQQLLTNACLPIPCLEVVIQYEVDHDVQSGRAIRSQPAGGTVLEQGSEVVLYVSAEPNQVVVPAVEGLTVDAATEALAALGLSVGEIESEQSDTTANALVVYTQPEAGSMIHSDSAVKLFISDGSWPELDEDEDGMPNGWEMDQGLDPSRDDALEDPDGDGLGNLEEYKRHTEPSNPDSDGDGLPDGWETEHGFDPTSDATADPDEDGLSNVEEYGQSTNPTAVDSDGDGLSDGEELRRQSDPRDADTDDDCINDAQDPAPDEPQITMCNVDRLELMHSVGGYADHNLSIAFSPDGTLLAAGPYENDSVKLWLVADGTLLHTLRGHRGRVESVAFSPRGTYVATGARDGTVRLWRAADGALLHTLSGHRGWVESVAFSPDGKLLASGSIDQSVRIWQVAEGKLLHTLGGQQSSVESVAFSPDGTLMAVSGYKMLQLWGVADWGLVHTLNGHTDHVLGVTFSADGALLASCAGPEDTTAVVWRVSDGKLLQTFKHADYVERVAFSSDGTLLTLGQGSGYLWQVADAKLLLSLSEQVGAIWNVALSPDGTLLAVVSSDGAVHLWHVSGD